MTRKQAITTILISVLFFINLTGFNIFQPIHDIEMKIIMVKMLSREEIDKILGRDKNRKNSYS